MTAATSVRTYVLDPSHSAVHFAVRHLMISKVRGTFEKIAGTLELPADGYIPRSISVTIDAVSINTREAQRDTHLRSADFLEVERFSALTYVSTSITPAGGDDFTVNGELELHGVKKPVTINATVTGHGKDPWGNDRVAYEGRTKISRKDFGLVWNQALETGGVAVGDEIEITLDVEAIPGA